MSMAWIAARLLVVQVAVGSISALVWLALGGSRFGLAALAGAACVVLPGAYFAIKAMSHGPGSRPEDMLKALYAGAAVRLVLTAALLFMVVPLFKDALAPLMTTLVATLAVQWFALLWKGGNGRR